MSIFVSSYRVPMGVLDLATLAGQTAGAQLASVYEDTIDRAVTVGDLLTMTADLERVTADLGRSLIEAHRAGVATEADFRRYNLLATTCYSVERWLYERLVQLVRFAASEAGVDASELAAAIPAPVPYPMLSPTAPAPAGVGRALRGLGVVPVLWAAAVLAILAGAALLGGLLVYAFTSDAQAAQEARQAEAAVTLLGHEWRTMLDARLALYRECVASNPDDAAGCARQVTEIIPTPEEAGVTDSSGLLTPDSANVIGWALAAAAVGAVAYGGWWLWRRARTADRTASTSTTMALTGVRRVDALDGPSKYYLEVR